MAATVPIYSSPMTITNEAILGLDNAQSEFERNRPLSTNMSYQSFGPSVTQCNGKRISDGFLKSSFYESNNLCSSQQSDSAEKSPFLCSSRPNIEATELIWKVSDFLELRRMASLQALDAKMKDAASIGGTVIYSPPASTPLTSSQILRWRAALFPNGTRQSRGHVGVYVHLLGCINNFEKHGNSIGQPLNDRFRSPSTTTSSGEDGNLDLSLDEGRLTDHMKGGRKTISKVGVPKSPKPEHWQRSLREGFRKNCKTLKGKIQPQHLLGTRTPKRLCMQYSIELLDGDGAAVPGTKVEQVVRAAGQESYWGYPRYLTILTEDDLARFLNALGGALRLHVCIRIWDGISTKSSITERQVLNETQPMKDAQPEQTVKLSRSKQWLDSSLHPLFEKIKANLLTKPDIFFDLEIHMGQTARLYANKLVLSSRCPILAQMLHIMTLPKGISAVYWPRFEDDTEVVGCLLQYIHFETCDLIRPETSGLDHEHRLSKLNDLASLLGLDELASECRHQLACIWSRRMINPSLATATVGESYNDCNRNNNNDNNNCNSDCDI